MNKLMKFPKAILAIAIMLCVALPTLAHSFEVDGIYYNYLDKTAKTVKVTYRGNSYSDYSNEYTGSVAIPSSVTYSNTTYSVTSIDNYAFYNCRGLTSVTIPNSVTTIGSSAFSYCTGLTSVTIPNSVTSIGGSAFSGCTGLTEVNITDLSAWCKIDFGSSEANPLYYAKKLKLNGTEIKDLVIPNDITEINDYAFYNCTGLTSITIPNSVTSIGSFAFYNTGWYNNQPDGILYLDNCCLGYKGNRPTGTLSIKEGTRLIGCSAFDGCSGLTSITISNSVTSIGDYAFYYCSGLTSVTIGNSVTSIGSWAFDDCTGLTEVNITDLSAWCKIDFGNSYSNPLYYAQKLKLNGSEITNLVIPNDITQIKQYAFFYCNGLTSVTIPNSVTSIGKSAFYYCPGLTSVTIGNSVITIGEEAFVNCGLRLIMSHCAVPPTCDGAVFGGYENNDSYRALLMIPEGSLIDYALADEWHKFTQVHEVLEAMVSTQEKNATFEIPTIEGATKYDVTVYSDITMTQLVATTHYDATGKIIPISTTLELSIDGFEDGVYYYKVLVKSAEGEILNNYIGTFEIDAAGVENIATDNAIEVARYDIHGRLLNDPTPGINIVKYSDGTTRKEIVKN